MVKTANTDNVEIPLQQGASTFEFGNQYNLNEAVKILGIEAYPASQVSKSPQQRSVVNDAAFKTGFLTLVSLQGNKEVVKNYPLSSLCPTNNNGVVREFDINQINVSKCSITFGNPGALVNNEVVYLVFHFTRKAA